MSEEKKELSQPVVPPKLRELHTPENTTMGEPTEYTPDIKKDLEPGTDIVMPVFLGTDKELHIKHSTLLSLFAVYRSAANNSESKEKVERVHKEFLDYAEKEFPGENEEELFQRIQQYSTFSTEGTEFPYIRNLNMRKAKWENKSEMAKGHLEADVVPRFPSSKQKGKGMRERILRTADSISKRPNSYDVLLRNSFIHLRISRSDLTSLSRLTKDISKEIGGYVRQLGGNSLTLSRASIYRVVWRHLSKRIIKHSVSDISDPEELAAFIKLSDFRALLVQMISEVSDEGIQFQIFCGATAGCDWKRQITINPSDLLHHDNSLLNNTQLSVLGSLKNHAATYSKEEVLTLQDQLKFVQEEEVFFDNEQQSLICKEPSLADYFTCFDIFTDRIKDELHDIRLENVDEAKYKENVDLLIESIRGCEYIHWVHAHKKVADPSTDDENEITYSREDPVEFYNVIYDLVKDRETLLSDLIRWAIKYGPDMSLTTVGINNEICPKCKKPHSDISTRGVTPLDPLTNFFTHVQFSMLNRVYNQATAELKTLS